MANAKEELIQQIITEKSIMVKNMPCKLLGMEFNHNGTEAIVFVEVPIAFSVNQEWITTKWRGGNLNENPVAIRYFEEQEKAMADFHARCKEIQK